MAIITSEVSEETEYEHFTRLAIPTPLAWLNRVHLSGGRVLHAGCGSGITTTALTRWFDDVVGVDYSAALIDMAQASNRHPLVLYRHADLIDFKDENGFDFIFSYMTIHDIHDTDRALTNIRRLANPGGTILIVDRVVDRRWLAYLGSYYQAAARFPSDLRRVGGKAAFWMFGYRTSRSRLSHLADDCHFSSTRFIQRYSAAFPSCRFIRKGSDYAMVWRKPGI